MTTRRVTASLLAPELKFSASRSSGPGGQNVNKVNSKITLKFDLLGSQLLTEDEKLLLSGKLTSRLSVYGVLVLTSQEKRSQLQNKEDVIVKFDKILAKAFEKKKSPKSNQTIKGFGSGTYQKQEAAIGEEAMAPKAILMAGIEAYHGFGIFVPELVMPQ